ncbi:AAA family ATPase [Chitinimonas viridis]|uniref:AAA family ATPase n=2 Tax=Chitinimonas TaxID=240411 RepID=A0ABT8BA45_9NEIS|nr:MULTISPECIES: AAA family ATPase [Chitinimonas]MDN3579122.1 AAA family ATPase [Chitinimonas viridis]GLR13020.1 chromosome partitioning protein ParA [Chitinimonas prasina]
MTIIAVFNQKGGVGKTTTTANLAAAMARNGLAPLVIDLDPQAHLTSMSGLTPKASRTVYSFYQNQTPLSELVTELGNQVNLIPSHMELAKVDMMLTQNRRDLRRLKKAMADEMLADSDTPVLIDCCPMIGVLSLSALMAADVVLVPVTAEYLAMNGAQQLDQTLKGLATKGLYRPRKVFINRYQRGHPTSEKVSHELTRRYGKDFCRTRVFESQSILEGVGSNQDVFSFAPDSESAEDFSYLLDELIESGFIKVSL